MEVFTLWLGDTNPICRLCISSWLKLGYTVKIYVDLQNLDKFFSNEMKLSNVILIDYKTILDLPLDNLLQFTDYFRFKRLMEEGGIWLDADMFLLKPIPNNNIIISSERTQQSGAFKSSIKEIPNIGCLKFPPNDPLMVHCVNKIKNSKSLSKKIQKNMFIFQRAIRFNNDFTHYKEYVTPAVEYCPINYDNVKNIYNDEPFVSKYKKEITYFPKILETSTGIHLWENLSLNKYKIDFNNIHPQSVFNKLKNIVNEYDYSICIPSYKRINLLRDTTLHLLKNNNISNPIYIFVSNQEEESMYKEAFIENKYPLNISVINTNTNGIGETRTFIRKYFPIGSLIIQIDDDIRDICSTQENFNIKSFFNLAFNTMKKHNLKFGGATPYENEFFMKEGYTIDNLKYTGGHLIFEEIRENPLEVKEKHFEDYIANIEYFMRDNKLLRFNDVFVKTKYYNPNGGIVESYGGLDKRKEDAEKLAKEIEKKYPLHCKAYKKKKYDVWNLRLKTPKI